MIRLTISSGLGPVEVREFVAALADVLSRELCARGAILEARVEHGEAGAAPRSVDLLLLGVSADAAPFVGTHVWVQRSARRSRRDRKRWYVGVSLEQRQDCPSPLDAREVRFEVCRSGGAGGQHVNKTESAVRAHHIPSGLRVRVESDRSQHRNKKRALELLAIALEREARMEAARSERARRARALRVVRGAPVMTWTTRAGALVRAPTTDG